MPHIPDSFTQLFPQPGNQYRKACSEHEEYQLPKLIGIQNRMPGSEIYLWKIVQFYIQHCSELKTKYMQAHDWNRMPTDPAHFL